MERLRIRLKVRHDPAAIKALRPLAKPRGEIFELGGENTSQAAVGWSSPLTRFQMPVRKRSVFLLLLATTWLVLACGGSTSSDVSTAQGSGAANGNPAYKKKKVLAIASQWRDRNSENLLAVVSMDWLSGLGEMLGNN